MTPSTGYFDSTNGISAARQFLDTSYLLGHVLFASTWAYTRTYALNFFSFHLTDFRLVGWLVVYTVLWPTLFGISNIAFKSIYPVSLSGLLLGAIAAR